MFAAIFRPILTVALLALLVPAGTAVQGVLDGNDDPKYVGGLAVMGLVATLVVGVLAAGPSRHGTALIVLCGCGVMLFSVSWLYGTLAGFLMCVSAFVLSALGIAAAVVTIDRTRNDVVSHF